MVVGIYVGVGVRTCPEGSLAGDQGFWVCWHCRCSGGSRLLPWSELGREEPWRRADMNSGVRRL